MYCVKKSELLDRESEDPAVRLALGETKVISETKEAFAKAGVNVTSLEEFATGKAGQNYSPSHKDDGLVVFLEPAEARAAMKNMAYKYVPLFLEWAPGDILEPKALVDNNEKKFML
ncbi:hypothetical protein DY000_02016164 [Brassica cretica]|uniref:Uncharacterized protein n=1 Tax=Brassica cretica TaxID=69181 RepID=A0ABQ7D7E5_BRACR|nr:hypothetical protein DY000_02016164 [Brassica cretica]